MDDALEAARTKPNEAASAFSPADGALYAELLGAHQRDLFGYVFALTGNWNDAQEVLQRVRIRTWEQFDRYDPSLPFGPWARAITYYLVLEFRREKSRQREYFTERVVELLDDAFETTREELSSSRDALRDCLSKLPKDRRELVAQYYMKDGPAALSKSLGMTGNALRQAVFRIRRALAECIQRKLGASV